MHKLIYITAFTFLSIFLPALTSDIWAHGGHEKTEIAEPAPTPVPAQEENIYAVESEKPMDHEMELPSSSTDMNMDMDAHNGHNESHKMMPQIKLSSHELVSPSRKGYKAAVGITVFAGLVFGILSFKRPNE